MKYGHGTERRSGPVDSIPGVESKADPLGSSPCSWEAWLWELQTSRTRTGVLSTLSAAMGRHQHMDGLPSLAP